MIHTKEFLRVRFLFFPLSLFVSSHPFSSGDALDHDFFWSGVPQVKPEEMPDFGYSIHEYELKQQRKKRLFDLFHLYLIGEKR